MARPRNPDIERRNLEIAYMRRVKDLPEKEIADLFGFRTPCRCTVIRRIVRQTIKKIGTEISNVYQ